MGDYEWTLDELISLDEPDESIQNDFGLYTLPDYASAAVARESDGEPALEALDSLSSNPPSEDDNANARDDADHELKKRRVTDDDESSGDAPLADPVDLALVQEESVYFFADAPFGEEVLQVSCGDRNGYIILGPHVKHLRKYTNASSDCIRAGTSLLGTPFEQIRHEATSMLVQEVLDKREAASRQDSAPATPQGGCELWVSKYKPTSFLHLLSDENTNRLVLKWIKSWDAYVFGKKKARRVASDAPNPVNLNVNTIASAAGQYGKRVFNRDAVWGQAHGQSVVGNLDADGLPEKKVLLLHGPPGTGKTTLAHILAAQAGYKSVEINASDERTGEVIADRLIAYTTTKQLNSTDDRPVLVVMDEIDGLDGRDGKGGVDALIRLIKGEAGKKKNIRLQRPIVCVCNDVYAPVLRPLKEHAIVIELRHAQQTAVVERLRQVCKCEKISVDTSALSQLVMQSKYDIRSSLNSLQFLSRISRRAAGESASSVNSNVQLSSAGLKDMAASRSPFDIWKEIFMVPRQSNARQIVGTAHSSQKKGVWGPRSDLEEALIAQGDGIDLIIEGCMENYSGVKYQDPNFDKVIRVLDAVADNDVCASAMRKSGSFSKRHDVLVPMYFAHYMAGVEKPNVVYPRSAAEFRNSSAHRRSFLHQMRLASSHTHGSLHSENDLAIDMVSTVLDLIHPPSLAHASKRGPKAAEAKLISHVVEVMAQFGIHYGVHATGDGTLLKLDPPVSDFASYNSDKIEKSKFKKPNAVAREVVIVFSKDYCGRSLPEEVKKLVYQAPPMVCVIQKNVLMHPIGSLIALRLSYVCKIQIKEEAATLSNPTAKPKSTKPLKKKRSEASEQRRATQVSR
jgi:chromosome transmission fidelity protein 18